MAFNLGSLAPLEGLLQSDKLLQQRQYNEILKQQAQQQLQKQQQEQASLAFTGRVLPQIPQIPQIPQMGIPQQGIGGQPVPPPDFSTPAGTEGFAPGFGRDPSGMISRGGQPPDTMLPGGLPAWKSGSSPFGGGGDPNLQKFQNAIYSLESDSGRDPSTSSAGAVGPMQIMPGTFKQYAQPGEDINNPVDNRRVGGRIASDLYNKYGGNTDLAAIGYNAGPGRADKIAAGAPVSSLPGETQAYLTKLHQQLDVNLDQSGSKMIQAGVPGPVVQDTTKLGMNVGRELNPLEWGRLTQKQIIDTIEKVGPNEPDAVKALTFMQLNKIMAPEERIAAQMWAKQNQQDLQITLEKMREGSRTDLERMREVSRRDNPPGAAPPYQPTDAEGKPLGPPVQIREGVATPIRGLPEGSGGLSRVGTKAPGGGVTASQAEWIANYVEKIGQWPVGMGRNVALQNAVDQVLAKRGVDPTAIAVAGGTFKADQTSLSAATKLRDAVHSYEGTALRNLDQATKEMGKTAPTGFGPWLNHWVVSGEMQMGDAKPPAAIASVLTFANEYAKVMSGSTGAQAATDTSRREAAEMFSPYFAKGQWDEAARIARTDMGNRMLELDDNVEIIKSRMGRGGASSRSSGQPAPAPGQYKAGDTITRGGKQYRVIGGDPADPDVEEVK